MSGSCRFKPKIRRLGVIDDLRTREGAKAFDEYNQTLMRWGQTRYSLEIAQTIHSDLCYGPHASRLALMDHQDTLLFWEGIIEFNESS